jgi:hypothetical protein
LCRFLRRRRGAEDPGSLRSDPTRVVGPGGGATGDGFDRRAGALAAGREPLLGVRREREIDAPAGAGVLEARERVAAERALRVGAQELGPAGADPTRRGPEPETRNTVATMVAETLIPSISSSPSMRIEPQRAFSRASRRTRLRVAAASGGRPGRRPRRLRSPRNSARCQRREVCGLTAKHDNRSIGSSRLAAASNARSAAVYRGHLPPRLKIATGGAEPRFRGRAHRRGARADKRNAQEPVEQAGQQEAQSEPLRPRSSAPPHSRIEFLYPTRLTVWLSSSPIRLPLLCRLDFALTFLGGFVALA